LSRLVDAAWSGGLIAHVRTPKHERSLAKRDEE